EHVRAYEPSPPSNSSHDSAISFLRFQQHITQKTFPLHAREMQKAHLILPQSPIFTVLINSWDVTVQNLAKRHQSWSDIYSLECSDRVSSFERTKTPMAKNHSNISDN